MADRAIGADVERIAHVGVQHAVFLDVRARADGHPFIVAAQHAAEPDVGVFLQRDAANQLSVGRDPIAAAWRQARRGGSAECLRLSAGRIVLGTPHL